MNKIHIKIYHRRCQVGLLLCTFGANTLLAGGLPEVVSKERVSGCNVIALVEGSSGLKKTANWRELAQQAVMNQAAKLNASHIVLNEAMPVLHGNGIITGKAYQCNNNVVAK